MVRSSLGFCKLQDAVGLKVQSPGSVAWGWRVRGHYQVAAAADFAPILTFVAVFGGTEQNLCTEGRKEDMDS